MTCHVLHDLTDYQRKVANDRGLASIITPTNVAFSLMSQVGELCDTFLWKQEPGKGLKGWNEGDKRRTSEKLSDILLTLVRLSDISGMDLGDATLARVRKLSCLQPQCPPPDLSRLAHDVEPNTNFYICPLFPSDKSVREARITLPRVELYCPLLPEQAVACPLLPEHARGSSSTACPLLPEHARGSVFSVPLFHTSHSGEVPLPQAAAPRSAKPAESPSATPECRDTPETKPAALSPKDNARVPSSRRLKRPGISRTLSVIPKGDDPKVVEKCFSPTHFDHGLFSPYSAQTQIEVSYDASTREPNQATSLSTADMGSNRNSGRTIPNVLRAADSGSSNATHSTVWSVQPSPPLSPLADEKFINKWIPWISEHSQTLQESSWDDLDIVWTLPIGEKLRDVIPGGSKIPVKFAERAEYLKAIKAMAAEQEKSRVPSPLMDNTVFPGIEAHDSSVSPPPPKPSSPSPMKHTTPGSQGSLSQRRRLGATLNSGKNGTDRKSRDDQDNMIRLHRTLTVTLPKSAWKESELGLYSPTHFEKDLFSPCTDVREVTITDPRTTIPPACSKSDLTELLQPKQQANGKSTSPHAASRPPSTVAHRHDSKPIGIPVSSSHASGGTAATPDSVKTEPQLFTPEHGSKKNDLQMSDEEFDTIIEDLEKMSSQLTEDEFRDMNINYCIPYKGDTIDLLPNGRHRQVQLSRLPEYLILAKHKRLMCIAGGK
ncbi:XTP3-transactivated gene A protein [Diplonema papillatum]|nr:XTP3-transactivated gene A protein [Diplonema papillatum]